jgi:hypothetical protein
LSPSTRDLRVGLLAAESTRQADGIRDYTERLLRALNDAGVPASLVLWRDGAWDGSVRDLDAVVVQYNPFSFGQRGFAPGLPWSLAGMRRNGGPLVGLMCHETYVDMKNAKWALMGGWQRLQLVALQRVSDVQFCTIQRYAERLRRTAGSRPVHHLPVASNLPDARDEREAARAAIGAGDDALVLTCLGMRHPGRLAGHVERAAIAAGESGRRVLALDLGTGDPVARELAPGVELRSTGFLDEPELARHVAASDLFLAPYMDGVSTRRTTVMGALQNEVAVLGTSGHLTDDVVRSSPAFTLTPVEDVDAFGAAAARLASDDALRAKQAKVGRETYVRDFDWPVLVDRLLEGLRG